jgi:hypothetical protein
MAALPISPSIYTSASGAKQNVTALPLTTAAVSIYGVTTSATYSAKASPINLVMHRDCLGFAAVDMPLLDPTCQTRVRDNQLGMSVRLTKWLDGVNDDLLFRLDLMVGWCILRDKFGCRVQG